MYAVRVQLRCGHCTSGRPQGRGGRRDGYTFVFGKQPNIRLWVIFYTLYHMISGGKWDGARISIV